MVLVAQRHVYSVPMSQSAVQKLPQIFHSNFSDSPSLCNSDKTGADASSSPVFSFEDDPSGVPLKIGNRAAGDAIVPGPKAKRKLLPAVDVAHSSSGGGHDTMKAVDQQPQEAWVLAQQRVKEREEQWCRQQAAECLQKYIRAWAAKKVIKTMRKDRIERQRAAEQVATAVAERAERTRAAAEHAEAQRLQQELAAAEAARVTKQRRDEALQSRVEHQRQRRRQRLELNRAAAAAARRALPPSATAREVSVSPLMALTSTNVPQVLLLK